MPNRSRYRFARERWVWVYGALIVVPALVLATLGTWAVRADRLQRQQQAIQQQLQIARLLDSTLESFLGGLGQDVGRELPLDMLAGPERSTLPFPVLSIDTRNVLAFHRERVYFGPFGVYPSWTGGNSTVSEAVQALIDEAMMQEALGQQKLAAITYRHIEEISPSLSQWARFARTRATGMPQAAELDAIFDPQGLSPSGIPVAILAALDLLQADPIDTHKASTYISSTLEFLRSGTWWLSSHQRVLYDSLLCNGLDNTVPFADSAIEEDAVLDSLKVLYQLIDPAKPVRRDRTTWIYIGQQPFAGLLVWSPLPDTDGMWLGSFLSGDTLERPFSDLLGPILLPPTDRLTISDQTAPIWSSGIGSYGTTQPIRSQVVPEWAYHFDAVRVPRASRLLWIAFVALLLTMLVAGLLLTLRVVRREMELVELQDEFVSAVSHEFKSPITASKLLIERLFSERPGTRVQKTRYREALIREMERLQHLVDRLLVIRQNKETASERAFETIDSQRLLETAITAVRAKAEAKGISIQMDQQEVVPDVTVDVAAVTDALTNLLENAVTYSPVGSTVTASITSDKTSVAYAIHDQGPGIPDTEIQHIFQRFYRGSDARKTNPEGAGLGLALVKSVAEAHEGQVTVESTPGSGSWFTLRLPISTNTNRNGENTRSRR